MYIQKLEQILNFNNILSRFPVMFGDRVRSLRAIVGYLTKMDFGIYTWYTISIILIQSSLVVILS
ncbi:hypothetical protein K504DRAFT_95344 [Pleomassaria siparia CBS 279.74]|uniref:Uncharacterized protein n=1 Tax=Pleomassaria siparia CBS 279.74 TaxID=1314801 RepID=A0A6G1JZJ2_9PLEO|nr:hypothetical protein K504DRAFT_95344 [Pleomassaria siparia CBS 279.74]